MTLDLKERMMLGLSGAILISIRPQMPFCSGINIFPFMAKQAEDLE